MYFRRPYQLSDGTRSRAPFDQASVVIPSYVFIRKKTMQANGKLRHRGVTYRKNSHRVALR